MFIQVIYQPAKTLAKLFPEDHSLNDNVQRNN